MEMDSAAGFVVQIDASRFQIINPGLNQFNRTVAGVRDKPQLIPITVPNTGTGSAQTLY